MCPSKIIRWNFNLFIKRNKKDAKILIAYNSREAVKEGHGVGFAALDQGMCQISYHVQGDMARLVAMED